MPDVWIRDFGPRDGMCEVRYGTHILARFVSKEPALAYLDWFWARRRVYLNDARLGRFTMEDLIRARKV